MGFYVNPFNETKEEFLERCGKPFCGSWKDRPSNSGIIFLIDNFMFTAAGLAYCEDEFNEFNRNDGRPKKVFSVSIEDLKTVFGEWEISKIVLNV